MRSLHLEKKGLRGLGIAESFRQTSSTTSILCGIVMRRDLVIDDFVLGGAVLEGDDATDAIIEMYGRLARSDVNYVLISGLILSMYNIVDIKRLFHSIDIPVIGLSYHDSFGLEDALKRHFPNSSEPKINAYQKLGKREKITLSTSHDVFVRMEGCSLSDVSIC